MVKTHVISYEWRSNRAWLDCVLYIPLRSALVARKYYSVFCFPAHWPQWHKNEATVFNNLCDLWRLLRNILISWPFFLHPVRPYKYHRQITGSLKVFGRFATENSLWLLAWSVYPWCLSNEVVLLLFHVKLCFVITQPLCFIAYNHTSYNVQTLTTKDCKEVQTNMPKNVGSMKTWSAKMKSLDILIAVYCNADCTTCNSARHQLNTERTQNRAGL